MQGALRMKQAALGGGELWKAENFIAVCTVDQVDRKSLVLRTVLTPKMAGCADEMLAAASEDMAALLNSVVPAHYRPALAIEKKRMGSLIALAQIDQGRWKEEQKTERARIGVESMRQLLFRIHRGEDCKEELDKMFAKETAQ